MIDQHGSLAEKFIKKGFWLYLFSFIIAPLGYIVKIIISDELTVNEVGIVYGVISLITLLGSFNDFGLTESLHYFLPKYISIKNYAKAKSIMIYTLLTQIVTSVLIGSFLIWGNDFLAINYFHEPSSADIIFIFAFFFFGSNFFTIISSFFLSIQNTFYQKLIELIRMGFTLIFVFLIWFIDIGTMKTYAEAWVGGVYAGVIIASILFFKKYYFPYFKSEKIIWNKGLFKELFLYAILILLASQAGTILSQIDMQMIIYMLGTKDAGYYTNYLSIIGIPFMIIGPIFAFLFPVISELHSKNEIDKIKTIKQMFTKYFIVIALATNTLFFIFGPIIAYILFGDKFMMSGVILQYSIFFLLFNFLLQINFNIMGGTGRVKERVKIISIAIIFNIITNYFLIKLLGVVGAALATGLGWVIIYILSERLLYKQYIITYDIKFILKNTIFCIILGSITWVFLLQYFEGLNRLYSLLFIFIYSIIYFILFVLTNKNEFKMFLGEIKKLKK